MTLWIFDLEPYKERYTTQMRVWAESAIEKRDIDFDFITPVKHPDGQPHMPKAILDTITKKVKNGTVLDAAGTNYYKAKQLAEFMKLIHDGEVKKDDIVFLFDFQYPGLEAIRYTSDIMGLDLKLYAVCHASSYVRGDFTEPMADWLIYFERGWWKILDGIFVGTEYHKNAIISRRFSENAKEIADKIHVTGNIFHSEHVRNMAGEPISPNKREFDIVFSNRWDEEKDPNMFVTILDLLLRKGIESLNVAITTSREKFSNGTAELAKVRLNNLIEELDYTNDIIENDTVKITIFEDLSKTDYYKIVANSKVFITTSPEEMFGYCLVEALALGCHPIVRSVASHVDIMLGEDVESMTVSEIADVVSKYMFTNELEAVEKILIALKNPQPKPYLTRQYDYSADAMLNIMLKEEESESPWL
jgi:glycosyltransferase involved in cell wall biosynthesis